MILCVVMFSVGAGSAGSTVAHRLSQKYRILLLEAGGDPHSFHNIPGFALDLLNRPEWDWQHETVPQKHAGFGLNNNVSYIATNALNSMSMS